MCRAKYGLRACWATRGPLLRVESRTQRSNNQAAAEKWRSGAVPRKRGREKAKEEIQAAIDKEVKGVETKAQRRENT